MKRKRQYTNLFVMTKNKNVYLTGIKFNSFLIPSDASFCIRCSLSSQDSVRICMNSARKRLVFFKQSFFRVYKIACDCDWNITTRAVLSGNQMFRNDFLQAPAFENSSFFILCRHVKPCDCIWNVKTRAILRMDYLDGMREIFSDFAFPNVVSPKCVCVCVCFFKRYSQMAPVA